jgi:maleamate amidohydrolase
MGDLDDLDLDYRHAGFSGSLGIGTRRALVLVDLTFAYLDAHSPLYAGDAGADVVAACARLLVAARQGGSPVIHTRMVLQAGGLDGGLFRRKIRGLEIFEGNGHLTQVPSELEPEPDEIVVRKQYASAFFGTSLASTLTTLGVDAVVVGGASTSGCVRATALDAMQSGFIPLVVPQACLDRDSRPHEANLFDLGAKYADLVEVGDACRLLSSARTDGEANACS